MGGWILGDGAGAGEQELQRLHPVGARRVLDRRGGVAGHWVFAVARGLVGSRAVLASEEGLGTWGFQRSSQLWGTQNHGPSPPEMLRNSTQIILSL